MTKNILRKMLNLKQTGPQKDSSARAITLHSTGAELLKALLFKEVV